MARLQVLPPVGKRGIEKRQGTVSDVPAKALLCENGGKKRVNSGRKARLLGTKA